MSKLSKEEILKIAKLAKLSLTDEEVLKYQNQLSSVLEYVSQIQKLKIKNQNYKSEIKIDNTNRAVEDKSKKCDDGDKLLNNAPKKKDGFYVVPEIFKN